ncbi:MAG: ABC transporter substrate-binding protein [Actinobacteria bacterium]|nr:ABC transporter substrate-binding protein [Actinomycetota bacterium]
MSDEQRPWPKMNPLRRWGPAALVLVLFVALGVVASKRSTTRTTAVPSSTTGVASLADNPKLPITYAEAKAKGTAGSINWANCDTSTGRIKFPSVYAPPCVPALKGSNGGATYQGVTATTIKIVYYNSAPGDITSAISGNLDPPDAVKASIAAYIKMFEASFDTYGRKIEIVPFTGTGIGTDETAARADAVNVATQIKAFASIGGPTQTPVYENELAKRGVLCISCGLSVPNATFAQDAPYMWGTLATPEQYLENVGLFLSKQLNDKPAKWAGEAAFRKENRVFGIIHYEQDPPVFSSVSKVFTDLGKKNGWQAKVNATYLLDLAKLPEIAAGLIAKLKAAGVTTVVFLGDPIMPIYLTKAATQQNYFPEWIVTGTVLTDTSALARNYDQKQWAHAFGVSTLPVPTPHDYSDAYRIYKWYYGTMPEANKTAGVFYPTLLQLFQGIQMAGPDLTPQTFAGGMFRLPPTGGEPGAPHVSYGNPKLFRFAKEDFTGVDDSTLIWWDPKAKGLDEQGKEGVGLYRYVDGGKRYMPGKIPTALQPFFVKAGSITAFTGQPPGLKTPDYPPPPGAPAAH